MYDRKLLQNILDQILPRNFRGSDQNIGRVLLWLQFSHDSAKGVPLNKSLYRLWNEGNGKYRKYLQNLNWNQIGFLIVE
jgi:hypothetical protein